MNGKNNQKALKSYKFWCTHTHTPTHMYTAYEVYMLRTYLSHMHTNVEVHKFIYELDSQLIETVTKENVNHRFFSKSLGIFSPLSK